MSGGTIVQFIRVPATLIVAGKEYPVTIVQHSQKEEISDISHESCSVDSNGTRFPICVKTGEIINTVDTFICEHYKTERR